MSDLECNSGLKYKVGDFVKSLCVAKRQNHLTTPVGSIGIIIDVDDGDELPYLVKSEDFTMDFWFAESELELVQDGDTSIENKPNKVKSDGGSSSYYFSKLPKEVIDEIVEKGGIELKDVVKYCFYNDADVKDITKAIKRIMEDLRGGGKEGIDAQYDLNKIKFFFNEFEKSVLIQKREQELSYDR